MNCRRDLEISGKDYDIELQHRGSQCLWEYKSDSCSLRLIVIASLCRPLPSSITNCWLPDATPFVVSLD